MNRLKLYLIKSKDLIISNNINNQLINICIGNEAADADSVISSIVYAYYKSTVNTNKSITYIPVVNIPRKDIKLRRDIEILLHYCDIIFHDLICYDELIKSIDINAYIQTNKLKFSLLDHNSLSLTWKNLLGNNINKDYLIDVIIDHHIDNNEYIYCNDINRNICYDITTNKATVGSTCTAIYETIINDNHSNDEIIDSNISTLLKGVITLDTYNMNREFNKGTIRDQLALDSLDQIPNSMNRNDLFNILKDAKTDLSFWKSLTTEEALLLDFKDFELSNKKTIGISAVLLPLYDLFIKSDFIDSIIDYITVTRDIMVVLTFTIIDNVMSRCIVILTNHNSCITIANKLKSNDFNLQLVDIEIPEHLTNAFNNKNLYIQAFNQKNLQLSRKQIAPILTRIVQEL